MLPLRPEDCFASMLESIGLVLQLVTLILCMLRDIVSIDKTIKCIILLVLHLGFCMLSLNYKLYLGASEFIKYVLDGGVVVLDSSYYWIYQSCEVCRAVGGGPRFYYEQVLQL